MNLNLKIWSIYRLYIISFETSYLLLYKRSKTYFITELSRLESKAAMLNIGNADSSLTCIKRSCRLTARARRCNGTSFSRWAPHEVEVGEVAHLTSQQSYSATSIANFSYAYVLRRILAVVDATSTTTTWRTQKHIEASRRVPHALHVT